MKLTIVNGIIIFTLACCVLGPQALIAQSAEDSARLYFEEEKYQEALSIWYGMIESGNYTGGTYYNIGLAESRLNKRDKAIMAFEKALRLKPFSHQIKNAILKEREKIENAIIPVRPFFLAEWYHGFLSLLRPAMWMFSGLLIAILAIIIYIRRSVSVAIVNNKSILQAPLILMSVALLLMLLAGLSYVSLYREDEGILHEVCDIRQAPSIDSPAKRELNPGEKMIIKDELSGWYQVSLLNLEEGWISGDCLSLIEMGKP